MTDALIGQTFELKHSHFYGELYDENEFMLSLLYPFRDVFHLVDLKDNLSTPKPTGCHQLGPAYDSATS